MTEDSVRHDEEAVHPDGDRPPDSGAGGDGLMSRRSLLTIAAVVLVVAALGGLIIQSILLFRTDRPLDSASALAFGSYLLEQEATTRLFLGQASARARVESLLRQEDSIVSWRMYEDGNSATFTHRDSASSGPHPISVLFRTEGRPPLALELRHLMFLLLPPICTSVLVLLLSPKGRLRVVMTGVLSAIGMLPVIFALGALIELAATHRAIIVVLVGFMAAWFKPRVSVVISWIIIAFGMLLLCLIGP